MDKIKVCILKHNFDGTPLFLAKLTQRGSQINSMNDLLALYEENVHKTPSQAILKLPHDTIQRMCYMTVAIQGLSTKAVSQLRTHATRLTFISTSTQYSEFTKVDDPYVVPAGLSDSQEELYKEALREVHEGYAKLFKACGDKDKAGYLLPQGLRKSLIVSGNYPAWRYVLKTRLCNRNTEEVQYICEQILQEMSDKCGKVWADLCLPDCTNEVGCREGKFCCGHKYVDKRDKGREL